jgi:hypothetical protein
MTVSTLRDWGHSLPVNDHLPKPSARLRTRLAFLWQPGYAKIVWTLEADAVSENESIARTRIRVKTTDPLARKRFRRYWAILSPGILLVHYEVLRLARQEATNLAATKAS